MILQVLGIATNEIRMKFLNSTDPNLETDYLIEDGGDGFAGLGSERERMKLSIAAYCATRLNTVFYP